MNVSEILNRLDLPFLAGVHSVLGFDDDGTTLRVVQLQKHVNLINRQASKFSVQHYFSHTFSSSATQVERIDVVKNLLRSTAISTSYVVSSIQTSGIKIIEVSLPQQVDDIDAWIEEHYERLIRLPIAFKDIQYSYEVHKETIEITFVRKSDIETHLTFLREIGLNVIGLSVGVFDAANDQLLTKLSLPPEYASAAGLALKGLGAGKTKYDVLGVEQHEKHELTIYKTLAQRTVLLVGVILLLLLLLPFGANMIFQNKIDALEEQRLSDPLYAKVASLESQVKTLERQQTERLGVQQRAQISRLMYTIGKVIPSKVWLYKLSMVKSDNKIAIDLRGYSSDPEQIMEFLKKLDREHCSPSLIRSGSVLPAEARLIPKNGSFTTFEIKAMAEN